MKKLMAMAMVLMMLLALPAVADTRASVTMMDAMIGVLVDEYGMGLFDADECAVYEQDGEVFVLFYCVLPYELFTVDMGAAVQFTRTMWDSFHLLHSGMSDSPLILVVMGRDAVYLMTDGETVYDGVLEQLVYTGMRV